jgi:hypothetical protein
MVLASVRDPDGRVVELTLERWVHIVVSHPELKAHRAEVMAAVERPYVRVSGQRDNESWYVVKTQAPSQWLRVVVAYEGERGWVVTAFARRRMP